jgi:ligand-binding sensor domain-containing protein
MRASVFAALLWAIALTASSCTDTNNNATEPFTGDGGASGIAGAGGAGAVAGAGGQGGGGAADGSVMTVTEPAYLWFAGTVLGAFTKSETRASNDQGPGVVVAPDYPEAGFHDLAFDTAGNLWVLPLSGDAILRLPAGGLDGTTPPAPDLVVTSSALKGALSLAFDAQGGLWVLSYAGAGLSTGTLARFDDVGAMPGTRPMVPSATIGPGTNAGAIARFSQATSIAFDGAGNLWVAAVANVMRFDGAATLQGDSTAAPSAIITSNDAFVSVAFDAAGSLWVTGAGGGYFAMRIDTPQSLTGTVTAAPAAKIALDPGMSLFASGMGFDGDGSLWIAMSRQILKIASPHTLSGSMSASPAVVLGVAGGPDLASRLLFRPRPDGLPIY